MRLKGRGGKDDLIADACRVIYEDEFSHMLGGIVGLEEEGISDENYTLMTDLVVKQLRARIKMRNAEFSFVLSEERIEAIYNGEIEPEAFDFQKAGIVLAANQ